MPDVTLEHFKQAAADIGAHGDNDTLPFDIDNRFIKDKQGELALIAHEYFCEVDTNTDNINQEQHKKDAIKKIRSLQIFSERLLVPTGAAGFRITTKLHPFWNIYFNGLAVAIAQKNEQKRSDRAHSYRYIENGDGLFDRSKSWRSYREATLADKSIKKEGAVVVQTDISSFYEHIYQHQLENCIADLFPKHSTVATQISQFLSKIAAGRSFGLPVGGQFSRILAEVLMSSIDQKLNTAGIIWHRYVDDFVLIAQSQESAYSDLSTLSHCLADYGLTLNRSKTTILSAKHYIDYVNTQLITTDVDSEALREIDLHFDPYSDSADEDYEELRETVKKLDIRALLNSELSKAQADTFLISQVGRTLKFHSPKIAIQLCETLLSPQNLHSFRASWSTIMRGVAALRSSEEYSIIFDDLDNLLDQIPINSRHLLKAEASCLHYLKTIKFNKTEPRAKFVFDTYTLAHSETVKRGCIDCWRVWKERSQFTSLINNWQNLSAQEQRMVWLALADFGDEGNHARGKFKASLPQCWALGIETKGKTTFVDLYEKWSENGI